MNEVVADEVEVEAGAAVCYTSSRPHSAASSGLMTGPLSSSSGRPRSAMLAATLLAESCETVETAEVAVAVVAADDEGERCMVSQAELAPDGPCLTERSIKAELQQAELENAELRYELQIFGESCEGSQRSTDGTWAFLRPGASPHEDVDEQASFGPAEGEVVALDQPVELTKPSTAPGGDGVRRATLLKPGGPRRRLRSAVLNRRLHYGAFATLCTDPLGARTPPPPPPHTHSTPPHPHIHPLVHPAFSS
eukprot:SAG11_NODE_3236_length_2591_cov_1.198636_2_plen_251_part_00